ncbi:MAG: molecular chaperone [Desulfitobacterium sp.]
MMNTLEEAKEIAQVRSNVYSLLSQCFFQPSEQLVATIIDGSLSVALQETVGMIEDEKVEQELARIKDFSIQCREHSPLQVLQDMKVEYNRLFVGPGHLLAPPYESVYKTRNADNEIGVVMGDAAIDAKQFYRTAGLDLDDNFKDLPDHIAVELHFMSYLCTLESANAAEGEFLGSHLGSWIADFSQTVRQETTSEFYRGIVGLAESWVMSEIEVLS